jgi:hemerythrin superfamily protein
MGGKGSVEVMAEKSEPHGGVLDGGLRLRMRSEERRIESQHEQLDDLCRDVYSRIDKDGAKLAINDFLLFVTALDAHMKVEEDIYFPALHGLREDAGRELAALVAEHVDLRQEADVVRTRLKENDQAGARIALDHLARQISEHERSEENLIARITEGPVTGYGHSSIEG